MPFSQKHRGWTGMVGASVVVFVGGNHGKIPSAGWFGWVCLVDGSRHSRVLKMVASSLPVGYWEGVSL